MGRLVGFRVFLVSASLLAFEVVLLRLFAVQTFHHFAYMAIGVALLGFAASGTALVLGRRLVEGREAALFGTLSVLLPVTLVAAPALAGLVPFEPTQFLWDWKPWVAVTLLYLWLAVPFVVGAGAIALALMEAGPRLGRLYAWNMVGSGAGGLLGVALLFPLPPDRALAATVLPALPGAVLALLGSAARPGRPRWRRTATRAAAALLPVGAALALLSPPWTPTITPYKGLPQVEAFPDAERVGEAWGPTGWVTAVRAPAFRHAPGLSLAFAGEIPGQVALFVDGETAGAATEWDGTVEGASFLDWLPSSAPYALGPARSVLVVGSGDGMEVLNALTHGADRVTAVELVGPLVTLADRVVGGRARVYADPRVRTVIADARGFAARTRERFDLIVLAASGTFAAGAAGVHGTGESYLETVEAYQRFLAILEPGGTLAVTRWLRAPPRDNVKLVLTLDAAVRASGHDHPDRAVAFVRSWATATVLVRPGGFGSEELDRLRSFASSRLFDVDWPPPEAAGPAPPEHNTLERPVYREALRAASRGEESVASFAEGYPFHVSPATDDRPYFGQFLRVASLPTLLAEERAAWLPVAEWGYLAVLATLVQSGLLSLAILGLPVLALTRARVRGRVPVLRTAAYFSAIGFGFIFVELAAIQRLGLVLGHPVFAASLTLAALLVFSGLGSALSDRVAPDRLPRACGLVAVAALVTGLVSNGATALVDLPLSMRAAVCLVLMAVPGALMGAPFPMGLRRLAPAGPALAWGWAANGVASVVGASAATLLAIEVGGSGLLFAGAAFYAVAAAVGSGGRATAPEPPRTRRPRRALGPAGSTVPARR